LSDSRIGAFDYGSWIVWNREEEEFMVVELSEVRVILLRERSWLKFCDYFRFGFLLIVWNIDDSFSGEVLYGRSECCDNIE
jgi:hypothetical protein